MPTLVLPSMVAGRDLADELAQRIDGELDGAEVVVDSRRLVSASPSFSAQLVKRLLQDRHARVLRVQGAPDSFADYLMDAARRLGVEQRLEVTGRQTAASLAP